MSPRKLIVLEGHKEDDHQDHNGQVDPKVACRAVDVLSLGKDSKLPNAHVLPKQVDAPSLDMGKQVDAHSLDKSKLADAPSLEDKPPGAHVPAKLVVDLHLVKGALRTPRPHHFQVASHGQDRDTKVEADHDHLGHHSLVILAALVVQGHPSQVSPLAALAVPSLITVDVQAAPSILVVQDAPSQLAVLTHVPLAPHSLTSRNNPSPEPLTSASSPSLVPQTSASSPSLVLLTSASNRSPELLTFPSNHSLATTLVTSPSHPSAVAISSRPDHSQVATRVAAAPRLVSQTFQKTPASTHWINEVAPE